MPATAICPHCQLTLRVPANYGGKSVKCPQCQQRFIVSLPSAAAPPGGTPVAVPPAAPPSGISKSKATFENLIMSVLDKDEEPDVDEDAHIEKVAGPSHYWRCPKCGALWEKKTVPAASLRNTRIKAMVRCETCGTAAPYDEVHSGKYDAPEVTLHCPHCHLQMNGPAEDLLGHPCPACGHHLPAR